MPTDFPTLSEDRHILLCVENVLRQTMHEHQDSNCLGGLELALRAVEGITGRMEEARPVEPNAADTLADASPADQPMHAEIRRRMDALEASYRDAPRVTAGRLNGWRTIITNATERVSAAQEVVERLKREAGEREAEGALLLCADGLEKAEEYLSSVSMEIKDKADNVKPAAPEGGAS